MDKKFKLPAMNDVFLEYLFTREGFEPLLPDFINADKARKEGLVQGMKQGRIKGIIEGERKQILKTYKTILSQGLSEEKALSLLEISKEELTVIEMLLSADN